MWRVVPAHTDRRLSGDIGNPLRVFLTAYGLDYNTKDFVCQAFFEKIFLKSTYQKRINAEKRIQYAMYQSSRYAFFIPFLFSHSVRSANAAHVHFRICCGIAAELGRSAAGTQS